VIGGNGYFEGLLKMFYELYWFSAIDIPWHMSCVSALAKVPVMMISSANVNESTNPDMEANNATCP
jgi:hypothetical protein